MRCLVACPYLGAREDGRVKPGHLKLMINLLRITSTGLSDRDWVIIPKPFFFSVDGHFNANSLRTSRLDGP